MSWLTKPLIPLLILFSLTAVADEHQGIDIAADISHQGLVATVRSAGLLGALHALSLQEEKSVMEAPITDSRFTVLLLRHTLTARLRVDQDVVHAL